MQHRQSASHESAIDLLGILVHMRIVTILRLQLRAVRRRRRDLERRRHLSQRGGRHRAQQDRTQMIHQHMRIFVQGQLRRLRVRLMPRDIRLPHLHAQSCDRATGIMREHGPEPKNGRHVRVRQKLITHT